MASSVAETQSKIENFVEKFVSGLNVISAVWLLSIALLILADVTGREAFGSPILGTNEIVTNSVLSILLLQLPLSILHRNSLRTTILFDKVGVRGRSIIDAISYSLAALLFLAIAIGSWPNMIEAWEILEQEGSGIITIPVYPIRSLVVFVGATGFLVCLLLIFDSLTRLEKYQDD